MEGESSAVFNALEFLTLTNVSLENGNGKELGRGAYGRVFEVKYCGQSFAAKEIHAILLDGIGKEKRETVRKSYLQECYLCQTLRHPNIVQLIGVYWPKHHSDLPVMVMEMMESSLKIHIETKSKNNITDNCTLLRDVALGLSFLHAHSPPVVHRDLSPNNILLTRRGVAKLSDLGVSRAIEAGGEVIKKKALLTKAPDFMPPEALEDNPVYDASLDVFSFAGIMLFVFCKQWPSPAEATSINPKTLCVVGYTEVQRRQKYLSKMDGDGVNGLQKLVECCLDNDPCRRPDIATVLEKIESTKAKCTLEVRVKPPVSPVPKPWHIRSLPNVLAPMQSNNDGNFRRKSCLSPPAVLPRSCHQPLLDNSTSRRRRFVQTSPTLGEAIQNVDYHISWTRCADLPARMYGASVAVSDQNAYITAGVAPDCHIYHQVFCYNITNDRWSCLPSPKQTLGILFMADGKLHILGGNDADNTTTNKVLTFDPDTKKWTQYFPNMLKERIKPGVVAYLQYIIVMGGAKDKTNFHDDIEILNSQQLPFQWQQVGITLPVPMWTVSATVSGDKLLIVGYNQAKGRSTSVYQLPVKLLLKFPQVVQNNAWVRLCSAPHHDAVLVPYSNPPVIIGGNFRCHPTSTISVYNPSENRWKNCASLSGPRINVAVANIYDDTIIVFGGHAIGGSVEVAMDSSLTTVEMGKVEASE